MARATVGDLLINYEQVGQGTDLVLIHGLGGDLRSWDAELPLLSRYHRVLRFDVRGFGASAKPPGPYSPALFARDLDGLLEVLAVESAHVLGISMGGVIAQRLALDQPKRIRSLVLVSTSSEVGDNSVAMWQRLAAQIEQHGLTADMARASAAFSPGFAARHGDIVARVCQEVLANDPRSYAAAARAVSDYHWTAELARVRAPTLILQGMDDRLTPPGGSVKMSRVLPRARLLLLPECGHCVPVEQPAVFRHAVLAFTAGVDFCRAPA